MTVLCTGVGRSGTAYMAAVLTAAGLPCGYEQIFNVDRLAGKGSCEQPRWGDAVAESSWFAVPWLGNLPKDVFVVHLARHPLRWLESWVYTVWPADRRRSATTKFIRRHTGTDYARLADRDVIDAAMRLYCDWNGRAATRANVVFRVDHPERFEDLGRIATWGGVKLTPEGRRRAERVPAINKRPHPVLHQSDLRDKVHAPAFAAMAERLGYPMVADAVCPEPARREGWLHPIADR